MATATARRRRAIEHLVATDLARARLARAAFDAVVDRLDLGPIALRTAADRLWVQDAIAGPIQRTADRALALLVDDLIETLEHGDPDLVRRILGHAPDEASPEPAPVRLRPRPVRRPGSARPAATWAVAMDRHASAAAVR